MNVDYFSCALIQFLVSKIYELIEIKMVVSKPELGRQSKRERSSPSFTSQLANKTIVTRRAIREVCGNSS